jgi:hypothetical protein
MTRNYQEHHKMSKNPQVPHIGNVDGVFRGNPVSNLVLLFIKPGTVSFIFDEIGQYITDGNMLSFNLREIPKEYMPKFDDNNLTYHLWELEIRFHTKRTYKLFKTYVRTFIGKPLGAQTVGKTARKSARKSARKTARKSARKIARKSARKIVRKTARKSARKTARKIRGGDSDGVDRKVFAGFKGYIGRKSLKNFKLILSEIDIGFMYDGLQRPRGFYFSDLTPEMFEFHDKQKKIVVAEYTLSTNSKYNYNGLKNFIKAFAINHRND